VLNEIRHRRAVSPYLPTALFVGCHIALNYILPHGSGAGSTARKSSESVANRRTAVRHEARHALAASEAPFGLNLFFAESADSRNLEKQQRGCSAILPEICCAEGMTSHLYANHVRILDHPRFADPFRNQPRENAERLAAANGIEVEFLRKRNVRKEDRAKEILGKRVVVIDLSAVNDSRRDLSFSPGLTSGDHYNLQPFSRRVR
jgi:hypothetical protein